MNTLDSVVEELKSLPPDKLEVAANYIHDLKLANNLPAKQALERTFGCLTPGEADDLERAILDNCETVDASQW